MGLKIWKPTCPSCGGGLNIQEGQLHIRCENCGSNLIIEGWETRPKLPAKIPTENYNSWPTGITCYPLEDLPPYSFEYVGGKNNAPDGI